MAVVHLMMVLRIRIIYSFKLFAMHKLKGTVRRYGSRAIARYFTACEIINKRTFTIIYDT